MTKNPRPVQIAWRTALIEGIVVLAILGIIKLIDPALPVWTLFTVPVLVSLVGFYIFYASIQRFIYRKVKLIYKNIHRLKSPRGSISSMIENSDDPIGEVEQEVMGWAAIQSKEIKDLKDMEAYRKEFLGNVSHELKTPIFSIQGYIDTLLEGGLFDETINEAYLYKASKNVQRLIHIVNDLETISSLEGNRLNLSLTKFDITALVHEVIESLEMPADANDIELGIKEGCDKPFTVYADRSRIQQVLDNLITNSIKYGNSGGRTAVGIYDMDEHILVEVADDGIGISEDNLNRVFERFFRADKSRSRMGGGTGLGLAIVKHMVEAHGQTINVRSALGVGSTFGFTLAKDDKSVS